MKLVIPNMIWHGDRERVLTLAFHPFLNQLVTGGSDGEKPEDDEPQDDVGYIKLWEMQPNCQFKFIGALSQGHSATVNCIKFSPNGRYMASGSDDKKIIIWEMRMRNIRIGSNEQKLTWCETKPLFGHSQEVYDLSWSRDCKYLTSASLDKMVNVWNVEKGKLIQTLDGHTSYVQGVVFDPKMKFIISMSQDRSAKVWKTTKTKKQLSYYSAYTIRKVEQKDFSFKLFLDENILFTFVRRPDFSPDGSIFVLPAAQYQRSSTDKSNSVGALVFLRSEPQNPALFINTNNKPAIAVKFCPVLFKKENDINEILDLPYKMIFAIATIDQVLLYSTSSLLPVAIFGNMHYASITDLSFKGCSVLGVSSCDGFCSFIQINSGEFGEEFQLEQMSEELRGLVSCENYQESVKYSIQNVQPTQIINEQQVVITETADGVKKKTIVPKMIQQL